MSATGEQFALEDVSGTLVVCSCSSSCLLLLVIIVVCFLFFVAFDFVGFASPSAIAWLVALSLFNC